MSVVPLRVDRYQYRSDGNFYVRAICRACEAKYDVYAKYDVCALAPDKPYCDDCLRIKRHMELLQQAKRAPKPGMFNPNNLRAIGCFLIAISTMIGVWWFLLWGGLSGYKYVDGVVDAIKGALR